MKERGGREEGGGREFHDLAECCLVMGQFVVCSCLFSASVKVKSHTTPDHAHSETIPNTYFLGGVSVPASGCTRGQRCHPAF